MAKREAEPLALPPGIDSALRHDHGDTYVQGGYLVIRRYGERKVKNGVFKSHLESFRDPSIVIPITEIDAARTGAPEPGWIGIQFRRRGNGDFFSRHYIHGILVDRKTPDTEIERFLQDVSGIYVRPGMEQEQMGPPGCTYCGASREGSRGSCGRCGAPL